MSFWSNVKDLLREMWFAPMFWPLMILFELSSWCGRNNVHWSIFVIGLVVLLPFVLILTFVLVPVNALVFAAVILWAPFALVYHIITRLKSP